jgi:hypothetical protein
MKEEDDDIKIELDMKSKYIPKSVQIAQTLNDNESLEETRDEDGI